MTGHETGRVPGGEAAISRDAWNRTPALEPQVPGGSANKLLPPMRTIGDRRSQREGSETTQTCVRGRAATGRALLRINEAEQPAIEKHDNIKLCLPTGKRHLRTINIKCHEVVHIRLKRLPRHRAGAPRWRAAPRAARIFGSSA